jgi:hypothetical protein
MTLDIQQLAISRTVEIVQVTADNVADVCDWIREHGPEAMLAQGLTERGLVVNDPSSSELVIAIKRQEKWVVYPAGFWIVKYPAGAFGAMSPFAKEEWSQ